MHCMATGYVLGVQEDRPERAYGSVVLGSGFKSTDPRTHGRARQDCGSGLPFGAVTGWYGNWEPVILCGPQGTIRGYSYTCIALCDWNHMSCMYLWGLVPRCVFYFTSL